MNFKILKAVKNSTENTIYAFFDGSELNPKILPSVLGIDEVTFKTIWWSEPECYGSPTPEVTNELCQRMITELTEQLKSRSIISEISAQVVQEFDWNGKKISLDNSNVIFAIMLTGTIKETIGTIYKNDEDLQNQELDKQINELKSMTSQFTLPNSQFTLPNELNKSQTKKPY